MKRAWDAKDASRLLELFHRDMVWPFPPDNQSHDPMTWMMVLGRYDRERWKDVSQQLFDTHDLVHNVRELRKIVVSDQLDAALAVVDVDTLWRDKTAKTFIGKAAPAKCSAASGRDGK